MAKGGSLERLKLGMLQNICQQLELEVPPKPVHRKALYVDLLEKSRQQLHLPAPWAKYVETESTSLLTDVFFLFWKFGARTR